MTLDELITSYGNITRISEALNISRQAIYAWRKMKHIPIKQQIRIEKVTEGKFTAECEHTSYDIKEGSNFLYSKHRRNSKE